MKASRLYLVLPASLIFLISGSFYFLTLSPTLSFIDSGELAAVCSTLGIAHPPGYPLYTIWGRIFSFLPIGEPIYRFNLMASFYVSLTNVIVFLSLLLVSDIFSPKELKTKFKILAATLIAILFSFSPILWSQAITNEVYSLNIFLCSLIIFVALCLFKENQVNPNSDKPVSPLIYFLAYLVGLSSGNHLLSLLLLPALIFLLITSGDRKIYHFKFLILILGVLILGVSIYLYLLIRSSLNPPLNWGDPSTWVNLRNHLSAKIYQSYMFSETKPMFWKNVKLFGSTFFRQFPFWAYPLMLLGFFKAFKQNLKITLFFLLIVLFNLFWSLNYGIEDIDPYFLQTVLISAFLLYLGLILFFKILENILSFFRTSKELRLAINFVILSILGIFFLVRLPQEFKAQNRSKNYITYDFTSNLLKSSDENALILTGMWDYYSPWLYLRFVENKRPDLEVIYTYHLQRSWYKNFLQKYHPELYKLSSQEIETYNQFALRMEKDQPVDSLEASVAFSLMIDSFIFKNLPERPVYITLLDAYKGYSGLPTIPEGLLFRFREERKLYPYEFPEFNLRSILNPEIPKTDKELACIAYYAISYYNRGLHLKFFNLEEEAKNYFQKAYYFKKVLLQQDPNFKFSYF
jgi:hypothetical protein